MHFYAAAFASLNLRKSKDVLCSASIQILNFTQTEAPRKIYVNAESQIYRFINLKPRAEIALNLRKLMLSARF